MAETPMRNTPESALRLMQMARNMGMSPTMKMVKGVLDSTPASEDVALNLLLDLIHDDDAVLPPTGPTDAASEASTEAADIVTALPETQSTRASADLAPLSPALSAAQASPASLRPPTATSSRYATLIDDSDDDDDLQPATVLMATRPSTVSPSQPPERATHSASPSLTRDIIKAHTERAGRSQALADHGTGEASGRVVPKRPPKAITDSADEDDDEQRLYVKRTRTWSSDKRPTATPADTEAEQPSRAARSAWRPSLLSDSEEYFTPADGPAATASAKARGKRPAAAPRRTSNAQVGSDDDDDSGTADAPPPKAHRTRLTPAEKAERAAEKRREKEDAKRQKEQQKAEERRVRLLEKEQARAARQAAKAPTAEDALRHLVVTVDSASMHDEGVFGRLCDSLGEMGCKVEERVLKLPNTMLLRTGDGSCTYALVYMSASKLGDTIIGGDFSKFVRNVLDCSGAALPLLFLHGRLKYFRDLATRQKRAFRAEVQGTAGASASQTAEAMTPDIFQSHLFTLQTFGVRVAECEKDDEVLREFDSYVKSVAFKPHRKMDLELDFNIESYERSSSTLREAWKNILCAIPMVSPMVADAIIGRFPTLASLCTQFETGDTTLLADILVQRPGSAPRAVGRATSTRIYQVLMGSDPNMLVE